MHIALSVVALLAASALPATAQDYYDTLANARHGNGYVPGAITAGWDKENSFAVIAFTRDGTHLTNGDAASSWKAVVTTGPKNTSDDNDEEDERYLDRKATTPKRATTTSLPKIVRQETTYSSINCPAVTARIEALKPLATFDFNPPGLTGNDDGGNGDGHQGLDLWVRIGGAELNRSAETPNSKLGRWFQETQTALAACSASSKAP